jgi:threonylcarbamoyladenosine tRNA methylthiotransferase MtaB
VSLVREILAHEGVKRLRISSLEPSEVTKPLLVELAAHREKICQHFHLPLQSGSDRILKMMRRSYDRQEYLASVNLIRSYFPQVHLGADVIVGFPGEDDSAFAETLEFIEQCQLASLHVFSYSKRPNTAAAKFAHHVAPEIIKARSAELRSLSQQLYRRYAAQFVGQEVDVLWENRHDSKGRLLGKSRNYLEVVAHDRSLCAGQETRVQLKGFVDDKYLLGV